VIRYIAMDTKIKNELYFVVLPMIHLGIDRYGFTEEVLTLLPEKHFATRFFADEMNNYLLVFKNRLKHLTGGHVTSYDLLPEEQEDGRYVVRVVQNVE